MFKANRRFCKDYNKLFRHDPLAANLHLLLCELANRHGEIHLGSDTERELSELMAARFKNPRAYQLPGGLKR